MNSERWEKIGILFDEALKLDEPERTAFLQSACGDDIEMLEEVRSLIEADTNIPLVLKDNADAINISRRLEYEGKVIGKYKIIKQIAEGGMGSVFLAERADGQFEQKVALKIIKPGMSSDEIIKRFQFERQILARLQHPNIARLYDGGLTDENLPYFTMEYVEGETIDEYCDKNNLSVSERLKLFTRVCGAIQYAHQNLVIHRDLKPWNIIIKKDGTVKLLDFGIAKVFTEDDLPEQAALTRTGLHVMTPEYASPEQIKGEPVTTSTDIYSLGLILYKLLTGESAYEIKSTSALELEKVICHTKPQKPSTIIKTIRTQDNIKTERISSVRKTQADKLIKTLSGDLDNICLMALRKEPERRYPSVDRFQRDIVNYLEERPVWARQSTIRYRTGKFISRHKISVISAALLFLIVTLLTTFYMIQLRKERDKAELESQKAKEVAGFLKDIFKLSDPYEARGDTITVRELLEKGSQKIHRELSDQPDVKATMLDIMGQVYLNLGLYDKSEALLKEALDIRRKINSDDVDLGKSLNSVGQLYLTKGEYDKAEPILKEALSVYENLSEKDNENYVSAIDNAAWYSNVTGDFNRSDSLYDLAIKVLRNNYKDRSELLFITMNDLALNFHEEGKYEESESLFKETLELQKKFYGDKPHPEVSTTTYNLAELLRDKGNYDEAEKLFRTSLDMDIKLNGPEHPDVAYSLQGLASIYRLKGNFKAAEKLYMQVLNMRKKFLGPEHPDVAYATYNVGLLFYSEEKYDSSKKYFEQALEMHKKLNGAKHPSVAKCIEKLSYINFRKGNYKKAENLIRQAIEINKESVGEINISYANNLLVLSMIKSALHDYDTVAVLSSEVLKTLNEVIGTDKSPFMANCLKVMAKLAVNENNYAKADSLFRRSLKLYKQIIGENNISIISASFDYSKLLIKSGALNKAYDLVDKNLRILKTKFKEDSWKIAEGNGLMGEIYLKKKNFDMAEPLLLNSYSVLQEEFGKNDFHTKEIAKKLVTLYSLMNKTDEANSYRVSLK
ncbi:MAG: serine/threonine-protein kinase [Ignavibacteriaceae bacterium]